MAYTNYLLKDVSDLSSEFYDNGAEQAQSHNKILDLFTSLMTAEEEIELSKEDMRSTLAWMSEQLHTIGERMSVMEFGSSESRKVKGEKNMLLLLKMGFENTFKQTTQKFSRYLEIDFQVETPVTDFVIQCMNFNYFEESLSAEEVTETLDVITAFEHESEDEQIEIEADNDSDENA